MGRFCSWRVAKTCSISSFSGAFMEDNERRKKKKNREERETSGLAGSR